MGEKNAMNGRSEWKKQGVGWGKRRGGGAGVGGGTGTRSSSLKPSLL